jgi:hypothetical protein
LRDLGGRLEALCDAGREIDFAGMGLDEREQGGLDLEALDDAESVAPCVDTISSPAMTKCSGFGSALPMRSSAAHST